MLCKWLLLLFLQDQKIFLPYFLSKTVVISWTFKAANNLELILEYGIFEVGFNSSFIYIYIWIANYPRKNYWTIFPCPIDLSPLSIKFPYICGFLVCSLLGFISLNSGFNLFHSLLVPVHYHPILITDSKAFTSGRTSSTSCSSVKFLRDSQFLAAM